MKNIGKYLPLILVVLVGILLQGIFIAQDKTDTPNKAAVEFAKAYYLLDDETMADQLCKAGISSDAVGDYMVRMEKTASDRGFALKYLKSRLYKIHVNAIENTGEKAVIRITAKRRTSINPLFEVVAVLFCLGNPQEVDGVINLERENDQWKVCGKAFDLI
jgi:hypothetical protein